MRFPFSVPARREHKLRHDEVRRQLRLGALAAALDPDLDHHRALADVEGLGAGLDLVAEDAGGEDVELELDRGEVVARRDAAEGRPGGDGVAERGPDAAMDEAARVQVALVDDDQAAGMGVLDLQRLDPEVARKAAGQEGSDRLRGDRRARVRGVVHRRGSLVGIEAESLETVIAVGLVALAHRLAEAGFGGAADEGVPLLGVAGNAVEESAEGLHLG